jgi:hypothetical protein
LIRQLRNGLFYLNGVQLFTPVGCARGLAVSVCVSYSTAREVIFDVSSDCAFTTFQISGSRARLYARGRGRTRRRA